MKCKISMFRFSVGFVFLFVSILISQISLATEQEFFFGEPSAVKGSGESQLYKLNLVDGKALLYPMETLPGDVRSIAATRDGQHLYTIAVVNPSPPHQFPVRRQNIATGGWENLGNIIPSYPKNRFVYESLTFSPDGIAYANQWQYQPTRWIDFKSMISHSGFNLQYNYISDRLDEDTNVWGGVWGDHYPAPRTLRSDAGGLAFTADGAMYHFVMMGDFNAPYEERRARGGLYKITLPEGEGAAPVEDSNCMPDSTTPPTPQSNCATNLEAEKFYSMFYARDPVTLDKLMDESWAERDEQNRFYLHWNGLGVIEAETGTRFVSANSNPDPAVNKICTFYIDETPGIVAHPTRASVATDGTIKRDTCYDVYKVVDGVEQPYTIVHNSSLVNAFPVAPLDVNIDIKPGGFPNCFNINGHGVIPVAILGSADFDVSMVSPESLDFAGLKVRIKKKGAQCSFEDVSGDFSTDPEGLPDGFLDLVCQFEDDPVTWVPNEDATATLTGLLNNGREFAGTDQICVTQDVATQ